jgi:hypothetical protein
MAAYEKSIAPDICFFMIPQVFRKGLITEFLTVSSRKQIIILAGQH